MIVSRPEEDGREIMSLADLDIEVGLVGDTWQDRPSARSGDGKAHPDMQITIMNPGLPSLWLKPKNAGRCPVTSYSPTSTLASLICPLELASQLVPPSWKQQTNLTPLVRSSAPGTVPTQPNSSALLKARNSNCGALTARSFKTVRLSQAT